MNVDCFVKFYGEFENKDSRFLVVEYCNGGTLENFILDPDRKIDWKQCVDIIYQVGVGILFLHMNGLTHRDLKGDNVLIHEGKYKIADFGFSIDQEVMTSVLGTPLYMATEIIKKDSDHLRNSNKVDVWALGIILDNLLTKDFPFYAERRLKLYDKIKRLTFKIPDKLKKKWDGDLQDLMYKCMEKDPKKRPDIEGFLKHPVFNGVRGKYAFMLDTIQSDVRLTGGRNKAVCSTNSTGRPSSRTSPKWSSRRFRRRTPSTRTAPRTNAPDAAS